MQIIVTLYPVAVLKSTDVWSHKTNHWKQNRNFKLHQMGLCFNTLEYALLLMEWLMMEIFFMLLTRGALTGTWRSKQFKKNNWIPNGVQGKSLFTRYANIVLRPAQTLRQHPVFVSISSQLEQLFNRGNAGPVAVVA